MRILACMLALSVGLAAQSRPVPARDIPVPSTVSPELQKAIAAPLSDVYKLAPKSAAEWKQAVAERAAAQTAPLAERRARLHVKSEQTKMGGVNVYILTPETIAPENRNRIAMHVHGGAYVFGPGEAATGEAILLAGIGHIKVISVDYRMPPDFPFPAALDDSVAVWKEIIKTTKPANAAIFGTSTGGALTLSTVLRLKELKLPLPGAIDAGTPWADLSKTGDTYFTNEWMDSVLVMWNGRLEAAAKLYAGSHDLKEPLLSPIYGDMHGFPPTILLSGTRDLFLSNTVRVHRKLLAAGVTAELHVFEAQSHGQYQLDSEAPEAFGQVSKFFNRHLGK